jgi:hypothetical protein
MKVRYAGVWSHKLDAKLPPSGNITVLHLGRGGVTEDGTLDTYNRERVVQTLAMVQTITLLRPGATVQVIWTGGHNRKQDRANTHRPASEGGAALQYARTLLNRSNRFAMSAEEESTSTVENATAAAELVPKDGVVVVATDSLHYMMRKVQFIFWLAYPRHRRIYIELPASPPDTNWKKLATHLVSTCTTILGMLLVSRGDTAAIQRRQVSLQKYTGH